MTMLRSFSALLLVGALAGGCDDSEGDGDGSGGSGGDDRASVILGLDGDATAGAMVFSSVGCATDACHGADGVSGTADPGLDTSVPNASDAQIVDTFLEGKGSMPAQSGLTDQQLADVLAYVSDTFG